MDNVNAETFDVTDFLRRGWREMIGTWCVDTIERLQGHRPDLESVLAQMDADPEFPSRLRREAIRRARMNGREAAARAEADAQAVAARRALDSALSYPYGA